MRTRTLVAACVGVAGCVAAAWGIRGLMISLVGIGGSCGDFGEPACPPETGRYLIGLVAGVLLFVGSQIAGARMLFPGVFLAVGVGSLLAGAALPTEQRTFPLLFGGGFALFGVAPVLAVPWLLVRRRRALALVNSGTPAIGTIAEITDTGIEINDNPRVKIRYRIEPQDGSPAFEGVKTMTVSKVDIPRRGQRFPIVFDPADRGTFAVITQVSEQAPLHIRALAASIAATGTAGEPAGFTAAPSAPPTGSPGPSSSASPGALRKDPVERLTMLNELRLTGALTEEEFQAQKARILRES